MVTHSRHMLNECSLTDGLHSAPCAPTPVLSSLDGLRAGRPDSLPPHPDCGGSIARRPLFLTRVCGSPGEIETKPRPLQNPDTDQVAAQRW